MSAHLFVRVLVAIALLAAVPAVADPHPPMVERLAAAIRFETVSHQDPARRDRGAFEAFLGFLRTSYPKTFSRLEVESVSELSLLLTWSGSQADLAPVLLDAHYDVVPVEPGTVQDWTHPPFAGEVEDGYIWGRGAIDDKGAVIGLFEATERLLDEGFEPQRTLYIAIGHDEEIGGEDGAMKIAALLEQRGVQLAYMIGEGGGTFESYPMLPDRKMAMIALAEKTFLTLTLTARGEGGHSSMPPENNALVRLARAVSALHDNPFPPKLVPPIDDMLRAIGEQVGGFTGFMLRNQGLSRPILLSQLSKNPMSRSFIRTTTAVTIFDAGVKENVVPQTARAKVNFRLLPGTTSEEVIARVRRIIDDPTVEIEADQWGSNPPVAPLDGEGYRRITATMQAVMPDAAVVPGIIVGTTDTRHYAGLTHGLYRFRPTFILDMSGPIGVHGTDERVSTEGLLNVVPIYTDLIVRIAAP
ncbi:MAG: M20/M25/M40 family metallo-hydrolase [bacterium]|nr:M20/M25/M40 family metallo-hydrolase [bacterium]